MKSVIITCEHGGNRIPQDLQHLFHDKSDLLDSHRGWDPGALVLAQKIASDCGCPLFFEQISRLVIEQNRSQNSKHLFSNVTNNLPVAQKSKLLKEIYSPYHSAIESSIRSLIEQSVPVYHFSIHTFTPAMDGVERKCDIGLLYDPKRAGEKNICIGLENLLVEQISGIRVRRNYPYKGTSDGLTTGLRKVFSDKQYCGIEIEINQIHFFRKTPVWDLLNAKMCSLIDKVISHLNI